MNCTGDCKVTFLIELNYTLELIGIYVLLACTLSVQ